MGLIYKHASCNIAATWAKDGSQGCFNTRDPAILTPTIITLKAKNLEPETTGEFLMMRSETYWRSVGHAPLNKRGWVLQERYLTPRQINFAEDEVSWECPQLVASEGFPDGLPGSATTTDHVRLQNSKPRQDYHDQHDLRRAWSDLVRNYSSCKLKFYTDKMIAIAGLARSFRERFDDVYLAGMWKKNLHKQLCCCESAVQSDDDFSREERGSAYFTEVMDASVESQHPSGLHSFVSGNLKVRAIAMWARIREGLDAEDSCPFMITASNTVRNDAFTELVGTDLEVYWDEECGEEEPELRKKLQDIRQSDLLLIYFSGIDCSPSDDEDDRVVKVKGLILVPGVNGEFTRAGMFFQYHPETKTVLRIIGGRLGLGPDVTSLLDKIDLGDPRLADLVETVSII
ncbi:hypothetical protein B0H67DRAFT_640612 [Lasiosphaeris hirsuta]|uniref:Heterokaryon incompatibility domain-containing protein n=1 Tax=Lasiosphaeris hirsuta TaxID=260670 RepID=A0AA40AY36_9PEZI|nr:hypothetical protein B0H67DRAFT_640612 [Lasiosphaeris hirsuta]